jgi:hypothetical protein
VSYLAELVAFLEAPNVTSYLWKLKRASGTGRTLQVEPKTLLLLKPEFDTFDGLDCTYVVL